MTSSSPLLNMPDLVMGKILENIDFQSILTLRKVCHDLRNFVDDKTPSLDITDISILMNGTQITMEYAPTDRYRTFKVQYRKNWCDGKKWCGVKKLDSAIPESWIMNKDPVEIVLKDLEIVLGLQKNIWKYFTLKHDVEDNWNFGESPYVRFYRSLKPFLENFAKKRLLQVESLVLDVIDESHVLSILPLMDSKSLKGIWLTNHINNKRVILQTNEIAKLEQWKAAKELSMSEVYYEGSRENLMHFSVVEIELVFIDLQDLVFLKNKLLRSSTLKQFKIDCDQLENVNLATIFGSSFLRDDFMKLYNANWFFAIPNSNNQVLQISHARDLSYIMFSRIELSEVAKGAVILN